MLLDLSFFLFLTGEAQHCMRPEMIHVTCLEIACTCSHSWRVSFKMFTKFMEISHLKIQALHA